VPTIMLPIFIMAKIVVRLDLAGGGLVTLALSAHDRRVRRLLVG
jgi:hypothetical protein